MPAAVYCFLPPSAIGEGATCQVYFTVQCMLLRGPTGSLVLMSR